MIDMRYKPYFLPQINVPYDEVVQKFDEDDIHYELIKANPDDLNPLQGIVFSGDVDKVELDETKPIYIDEDNNVVDGHHRWVKALSTNTPIMALSIKLNYKDASRLLNKIQDIYDYEKSRGIEEVMVQDTINYYGDDENQFLTNMDEENLGIQEEKPSNNEKTIIAYRKAPLSEDSVVGNFFTLKPIDGYSKYEIDFNNLLDTSSLGIALKDSQNPIDVLAKLWFPNINFIELAKNNNAEPINIMTKAISEKAMKMGYDGIKYGDSLIQGLK
jgi:hypothetical protein